MLFSSKFAEVIMTAKQRYECISHCQLSAVLETYFACRCKSITKLLDFGLSAGFLAGAGGEVFGAGSLLQQLAGAPQWFVATLVLVSAGSVIPYFMVSCGDVAFCITNPLWRVSQYFI